MIVHGCIEIHLKDCGGWIIVMGVQGFINFATSIPRNFTGGGISCPCRKCQNKKYMHPDVVMMHLPHKGFIENYQCWYAHGEVFISKRRMGEGWLGQLLVLATCMKRQITTLILTGIWLWMQ
jgi:hypothetical protein